MFPTFTKTELSEQELEALSIEDARDHIRALEAEYKNTQRNYDKEVDKNIALALTNSEFRTANKQLGDKAIVLQAQFDGMRTRLDESKELSEERRIALQWYQKRYGLPAKETIKPKLNVFQRLVAKLIGM